MKLFEESAVVRTPDGMFGEKRQAPPQVALADGLYLTADSVRQQVKANPRWDSHLDDDPNWIKPAEQFGWLTCNEDLSPWVRSDPGDWVELRVPVEQVEISQPQVSLEAVHHYLEVGEDSTRLFDRDGWFGTNIPVFADLGEGRYVVLDGTSRVTAAKLRGAADIGAWVVQLTTPHTHSA